MRTGLIIAVSVLLITSSAFCSEGQQESVSPFAGSLADMVCAIAAFVVLVLVLWKFAWKMVLDGLNARQAHIEKQINDAESKNNEAIAMLEDYKRKLESFEQEGKAIVDSYSKKAQSEGREIVAEAREQIEQMEVNARGDIERAQKQARAELLSQSGDILLRLGEEILGKAMDADDHKRLVEKAIEKLKEDES